MPGQPLFILVLEWRRGEAAGKKWEQGARHCSSPMAPNPPTHFPIRDFPGRLQSPWNSFFPTAGSQRKARTLKSQKKPQPDQFLNVSCFSSKAQHKYFSNSADIRITQMGWDKKSLKQTQCVKLHCIRSPPLAGCTPELWVWKAGLHGQVKFLCYNKHFHWFQGTINCFSDAERAVDLILTSNVGNAKAGSRADENGTSCGQKRRSGQYFPLGSSTLWDGQPGNIWWEQGKKNDTSLSLSPNKHLKQKAFLNSDKRRKCVRKAKPLCPADSSVEFWHIVLLCRFLSLPQCLYARALLMWR